MSSAEVVPVTMPQTDNKTALIIAAHPDDADFGAAGTSYVWSRLGWTFNYLVCTDGSKGTSDPHQDPVELIRIRQEEQREAAHRVGAKDVYFLDHVDGELQPTREFLGQVVRHIRMLKPYAVFTHDPEAFIVRDSFINHPDHRVVGTAALDAVYPTARDHLNFPEHLAEGLEPHKVQEVLLWGSNQPNMDIDITADLDRKIHALTAHVSQFGEREDFINFVRERWKADDGRYLEQFRRIQLQF